MKRISTGITPDLVKNWNISKAIREILQNYLDVKKQFACEGFAEVIDGRANVTDYGPGLEMRHLALGNSEKNSDCIGMFGKGLKQALIVLTREGRKVEITSNGKIITPIIAYCNDFETDTLHLVVEEAKGAAARVKGTKIKFDCSREEFVKGKSYFLGFNGQGIRKVTERILLPGGNIYINDSKVGFIEGALFSYRLTSKQKDIMSSDRDMVDLNKLKPAIRELLSCEALNSEVCEAILTQILNNGLECFEARCGLITFEAKRCKNVWARAFKKVFGSNAVIMTCSDGPQVATELSYRGYKPYSLPYEWEFNLQNFGIKTAGQVLRNGHRGAAQIALKELTDVERENLKGARELVETYYATPGNVKVVEDLNRRAGVAGEGEVRGLYDRQKDTIYICRRYLIDPITTLDIIIHETVHKVTGHSDCTAEFEAALTLVAASIMLALGGK